MPHWFSCRLRQAEELLGRIDAPDAMLGPDALASATVIVLRSGRRNYALLRFSDHV